MGGRRRRHGNSSERRGLGREHAEQSSVCVRNGAKGQSERPRAGADQTGDRTRRRRRGGRSPRVSPPPGALPPAHWWRHRRDLHQDTERSEGGGGWVRRGLRAGGKVFMLRP